MAWRSTHRRVRAVRLGRVRRLDQGRALRRVLVAEVAQVALGALALLAARLGAAGPGLGVLLERRRHFARLGDARVLHVSWIRRQRRARFLGERVRCVVEEFSRVVQKSASLGDARFVERVQLGRVLDERAHGRQTSRESIRVVVRGTALAELAHDGNQWTKGVRLRLFRVREVFADEGVENRWLAPSRRASLKVHDFVHEG